MKPDAVTLLLEARALLAEEATALNALGARLNEDYCRAVNLLYQTSGKVVIVGIGKSGHVGQKMAATFCSTGTPAVFVHATEAVHGDLGIYRPGDPTLLLSKSGSTAELLRLVPTLRALHSPLIAIVGNPQSPLAGLCDVVLDASVAREVDPLGIVPTASALVTLALGDALASALMRLRGFAEGDFARYHPSGQLGRNLLQCVEDVMHRAERVAWLSPSQSMREAVIALTEKPLGAACVVGEGGKLLGLVTDGDIRRALRRHEDIRSLGVEDIMTRSPISIHAQATLSDAVRLMEDRPSQISVLPVVEREGGSCLGLIRIHDIYQPQLP